ncbi:hypothetical protein [Frigoriglobus tundricola]|uniref:Uncharacterized protein n=1 Tax=Frigoriglobus tundricola TaxID=2774151 RepID=A0A6M5YUY0_9BACT|nr:hypothetical protein [Frigoriglobus tundricola]QJW96692.1 hypothetical protein FTUN_4251 [Frigoriglobus tundricola]
MSTKPDLNDPNTWPVVDCVPSDVFLGSFVRDCTPNLTDEQKSWPVADCKPSDVFLDPVFVVELTIRPEAGQVEIVHGTAELLRALDARETELGGSGLILDARRHPAPKGKVRLVLHPKTVAGAKNRLQQLADLIESGTSLHSVIPSAVVGEQGSFVGCHAVLKP